MSNYIGGISKTINYKGNRIDIGGHRFFSKSDKVMDWWLKIFPIQDIKETPEYYSNNKMRYNTDSNVKGFTTDSSDKVMLLRKRLSRIYFLRKFFNYPITLNLKTIINLGLWRIIKISLSYFIVKIYPVKKENSLEDFFINRFGRELYKTFFKDYTEKVWGVSCRDISPSWGAQRIKGLSIRSAIIHAIKKIFFKNNSVNQKDTETSLIENFLYPKFGPGQLWEEVARIVQSKGGVIYLNQEVVEIIYSDFKIIGVKIFNHSSGKYQIFNCDFLFSTMPVKDLINSMGNKVPENIKTIANGLVYRDFITVGLLLKKLKIKNDTDIKTENNIIPDNWIYIQEKEVKLGRIQLFNNWSPYMVNDKDTIWIGLEYFCNEGDELWLKSKSALVKYAINELVSINFIEKEDVIDYTVYKIPKAYPAYFGSYSQFNQIVSYTSQFDNLFLIGRNGMHRYNNQDHSMLTAMVAVDNIIAGIRSKENIWNVNTEKKYHE